MAVYIPSGTIHGIRNTGNTKLMVAFMVAPGREPSKSI
jgi:mannose-6-phosphate isomerase-like protein (cupin superfamily)